jgi:general secretion pathway protein F
MAVYEYQAIATKTGKRVRGVIDADSPAAARRKLRDQSLSPTKVAESFVKAQGQAKARKGGIGRISPNDVSVMTRQLAVLLHAGMPLVEGLGALLNQTSNPRLQKVVYDVRDRVNEGMRLADALRAHGKVFSELYVNMVGAGESSGALEQVLFRLADIMERQVRLARRVRSALAYPVLMGVVGVSVITFLMTVIVPKITDIINRQGQDLPLVTEILIWVSGFVGTWWPALIAGAVLAVVLWRVWVRRPEGRRKWDKLKLRMPLYGPLYVKLLSGRISRTMGTMLSSGLTMMTALDVVKTVVQNRVIEEAMEDVKAGVRRGRDLSVPLREMNLFPPMMISMIELGQRSGELDAMLLHVADTYDEEIQTNVDAVVSILEPLMIVIMAVFVGFIVIATLLPIFRMSSGY